MASNGEGRRLRTVRVRKRISYDSQDPTQTVLKRTRVVKVARQLSVDPPLEDDFQLEVEGDPKNFLKLSVADSQDIYFGPRYYNEGKLVPHSVVGPPDMFEKLHTAEMKTHTLEEKSRSDLVSESSPRRPAFMSIRKTNKPPSFTPEQNLQAKLQKIEEGKKKDAATESERLSALPIGVRIVEDRQRRCLRQYAYVQTDWEHLTQNLAKKTSKPVALLMQNSTQEFRERIEEMDYLDRAVSAEEKAGSQVWYMSLRSTEKGNKAKTRGSYIPVGNLFSGIYAQVRERTNTAEALIRRPLNHPQSTREVLPPVEEDTEQHHRSKSSVSRKTFRDYPYFQKRMKEEELHKSLHPVQASAPQLLLVQGKSKFEAELKALKDIGLDQFRPELTKPGDLGEETLAEHYDIKFKY